MNDIASPRSGEVAFAILHAVHHVEAELEHALEAVGLSVAKYGVVSKLAEAGEPLNLSVLADRCSCVRSNITQLVDRLEADHLVERMADPQDRRAIRARLTPAGQSRHVEGVRAVEEAERRLLDRLTGRERETLIQLMRSLTG